MEYEPSTETEKYEPFTKIDKYDLFTETERRKGKSQYKAEVEEILGGGRPSLTSKSLDSSHKKHQMKEMDDDEETDDDEEMEKDFDNEEEEYSSPTDVGNLESILVSFSNAGFVPNDITPWVSSLSDEVLEESSDEQIMRRWIEWKSDDADTDMVIGTEGRNEGDSDVTYLMKWGLIQEAATYLRQQFSLEEWCEYDLHSRMMWWVEEGRNIMLVVTTLYPTVNPLVGEWTDGINNTSTYYVSPEISREALNDDSTNIINNLCVKANCPVDVLKLFHATRWQYVQGVLNRIRIGYNSRKTDFSPDRAFYTTTEFHTALRHCYYRKCSDAAIIIFLLPHTQVTNSAYYVYLGEEDWREVVVKSRNGIDSSVVEGKWFVQGKQLWNSRKVQEVFRDHEGDEESKIDEAKKIAKAHEPPRDQLAVIRDDGADILNSAINVKGVIILPNDNFFGFFCSKNYPYIWWNKYFLKNGFYYPPEKNTKVF
ncbi:hypothetical protein RhiirA4_442498 [Rhizophagus irregularis]|uniref:Uncharacterized protein n=1 Tax=Rhizophagus irregularis TaxID=588596 RepID=A0A2I1G9S4_9GLOM|nr:hypothetical protein RhiirA4_442498 [Rhizophagus irregularis]